jgi:hypothetical protein
VDENALMRRLAFHAGLCGFPEARSAQIRMLGPGGPDKLRRTTTGMEE